VADKPRVQALRPMERPAFFLFLLPFPPSRPTLPIPVSPETFQVAHTRSTGTAQLKPRLHLFPRAASRLPKCPGKIDSERRPRIARDGQRTLTHKALANASTKFRCGCSEACGLRGKSQWRLHRFNPFPLRIIKPVSCRKRCESVDALNLKGHGLAFAKTTTRQVFPVPEFPVCAELDETLGRAKNRRVGIRVSHAVNRLNRPFELFWSFVSKRPQKRESPRKPQ